MARLLENWIKSYMVYTRHLEAPDPYHFWSGVSALAGALRGKVWIDMGYWKWRPNFFIIFVAPPGIATKSTSIGNALELLRAVPGIHFGPDSATWQGITDAFIESIETFELPTKDKVQSSCITVAASELGTFLDPQNREMVDVLVDLWDGRSVPWKRRTKGEGQFEIPNPWLNFVGATTPAWIAENFPRYAVTGGFTSRTVFVFADYKRHFVAYPQFRIDQEDRTLKNQLVHDLIEVAKITGEYGIEQDAVDWGIEWYERHWTKRPTHSGDDRMSGYLARKQTHIHKVAMVLAAACRDETRIHLEDLQAAEQIVTGVEAEMPRVFESISDSIAGRNAQVVLLITKSHPQGIRKDFAWRECVNYMSQDEFDATVKGLCAAHLVIARPSDGGILLYPGAQSDGSNTTRDENL